MRRISAVALVTLGITCATAAPAESADLPAAGPKGLPQVKPIVRPPYIGSVKKVGGAAYTNDSPLVFEVEVVNPGASALTTSLLADRVVATMSDTPQEAGRIASVPVTVPANGRATVTLTDPKGLVDGCVPNYDRLTLEAAGSTMLKITSTCAFGAQAADALEGLAPDQLTRQVSGKLHYHAARLVTRQPTCGGRLVMEATVKNGSATPVTDAYLDIVAPDGESFRGRDTFNVAPSEERVRRGVSSTFDGHPGKWWLRVGGVGAPVFQPRWGVNVTRLCGIATELNATVRRLPSPTTPRGE